MTRRSTAAAPRQPLWSCILDDLWRRIAANEFGIGFPGELELAVHYGVSRTTVRAALTVLRDEGVVTAARGRRPRITEDRGVDEASLIPGLFAALDRGGGRRTVIDDVRLVAPGCDDELAAFEGVPALVRLHRVHFLHHVAVMVDRSWLPAEIGEPLLTARSDVVSDHENPLRLCGRTATSAWEELVPAVAGPSDGALLGCGAGAAVFALDRTACADGAVVEFRRLRLRPNWLRLLSGPERRDGRKVDVVIGGVTRARASVANDSDTHVAVRPAR